MAWILKFYGQNQDEEELKELLQERELCYAQMKESDVNNIKSTKNNQPVTGVQKSSEKEVKGDLNPETRYQTFHHRLNPSLLQAPVLVSQVSGVPYSPIPFSPPTSPV